jgi:hypothetical protein
MRKKILVCPYIIFCKKNLLDILMDIETTGALVKLFIFHPNKKNDTHFSANKDNTVTCVVSCDNFS